MAEISAQESFNSVIAYIVFDGFYSILRFLLFVIVQ